MVVRVGPNRLPSRRFNCNAFALLSQAERHASHREPSASPEAPKGAWDGLPMDLPYVMECLWRPPPHLEAVVARERETSRAA